MGVMALPSVFFPLCCRWLLWLRREAVCVRRLGLGLVVHYGHTEVRRPRGHPYFARGSGGHARQSRPCRAVSVCSNAGLAWTWETMAEHQHSAFGCSPCLLPSSVLLKICSLLSPREQAVFLFKSTGFPFLPFPRSWTLLVSELTCCGTAAMAVL